MVEPSRSVWDGAKESGMSRLVRPEGGRLCHPRGGLGDLNLGSVVEGIEAEARPEQGYTAARASSKEATDLDAKRCGLLTQRLRALAAALDPLLGTSHAI